MQMCALRSRTLTSPSCGRRLQSVSLPLARVPALPEFIMTTRANSLRRFAVFFFPPVPRLSARAGSWRQHWSLVSDAGVAAVAFAVAHSLLLAVAAAVFPSRFASSQEDRSPGAGL